MQKLFILLACFAGLFGGAKAQTSDTLYTDWKALYVSDSSFTTYVDSNGKTWAQIIPVPFPTSAMDTSKARAIFIDHTVNYGNNCQPYFLINGQSYSFTIDNKNGNGYDTWRMYGDKFALWYLTIIWQSHFNLLITLR